MADNRVVLYTTIPCGFCTAAKSLLNTRGISYEEVDLSRDAESRQQLLALTGQMTFPQLIVDKEPLGGFRELVEADRSGRLSDLAAAA